VGSGRLARLLIDRWNLAGRAEARMQRRLDDHLRGCARVLASNAEDQLRLVGMFGRDRVGPPRVMEFASYHAIVACVSAGAGIAVVPRSVLQLAARTQVHASALPPRIAQARTMLAWRANHRSTVLDALRAHLA